MAPQQVYVLKKKKKKKKPLTQESLEKQAAYISDEAVGGRGVELKLSILTAPGRATSGVKVGDVSGGQLVKWRC